MDGKTVVTASTTRAFQTNAATANFAPAVQRGSGFSLFFHNVRELRERMQWLIVHLLLERVGSFETVVFLFGPVFHQELPVKSCPVKFYIFDGRALHRVVTCTKS